MADDILNGARVMIVEDEMLVAVLIEDFLSDHGCQIVGPASTVAEALALIESAPLDAAVMDLNIAGEKVFPVAEALERRGVPFLIVSGYGQSAMPADRPNWRVCQKPFKGDELVGMLRHQMKLVRHA